MAQQQLPHGLKRLSNGEYEARPRDPITKQRKRMRFARLKDALNFFADRRSKVLRNEYVPPARIPTVEEGSRGWYESKKTVQSRRGGGLIKESTLDFWFNQIERYVIPTLGRYRMDKVDPKLIDEQRKVWISMGLGPSSVNKILTTLTAIFKKQVGLKAITFNPVEHVERMATGSNEVGEDGELHLNALEVQPNSVYGPEEIARLIERAEEGFDKTIIEFDAFTALRSGELLAAMWSEIDWDAKTFRVRRNWAKLWRNDEPVFSTPKTRQSIRTVPLSDHLCLTLKKWKLQCPPSKWDLIFPTAEGFPKDRKGPWNALQAAAKKAKLPRRTIHSLRHSFASIHLAAGTPITEVSALLGHANVNITMRVYAHFIPKMKTDSAALLEELILKNAGRSAVAHEGK